MSKHEREQPAKRASSYDAEPSPVNLVELPLGTNGDASRVSRPGSPRCAVPIPPIEVRDIYTYRMGPWHPPCGLNRKKVVPGRVYQVKILLSGTVTESAQLHPAHSITRIHSEK